MCCLTLFLDFNCRIIEKQHVGEPGPGLNLRLWRAVPNEQNKELGTKSLEQRAWNKELGTKSLEQRAWNKDKEGYSTWGSRVVPHHSTFIRPNKLNYAIRKGMRCIIISMAVTRWWQPRSLIYIVSIPQMRFCQTQEIHLGIDALEVATKHITVAVRG